MSTITDYQRQLWHVLSYMTLCRFYIIRDEQTGHFVIKKVGKIRLFFYYFVWMNSIVKLTYLTLAYRNYLSVEVHFLDQMGMWDWFLCFVQIIQETNLWCRKYPLFDVLCKNWKMQEEVFRKLGSPEMVKRAILKNDRSLVKMHTFIITFGLMSIWLQFLMAPKYASNTYAAFSYDNWLLRILFGAHECLFIFHIWIFQAFSIILCELYASSYTHIMREMTEVLRQLIEIGTMQQPQTEEEVSKQKGNTAVEEGTFRKKYESSHASAFRRKFISKRRLDPDRKVPGTEYDIKTLLRDYQKMMIVTESFNSWVGKLMGGTMAANYSQFVTDVFMMFQLVKEADTDMLSVFFYAEDCIAGMVILFRMLMLISRLYTASEEFLHVLKQYLTYDTPLKKYLRKKEKCLRIIATNLGGYKTKSITVPKGVNALFNWYIAAAMWKRPKDRRT